MKNINEIVTGGQPKTPAKAPLDQSQANAVGYFFARLRAIYANQYTVNYPDERTEMYAKREYARQICDITRERMDEGFEALHQQRQQNHEDWKYLDLDKIIGLIKTGGQHWSHRVMAAKDDDKQKALPQKRSQEVIDHGSKLIQEARKGLV